MGIEMRLSAPEPVTFSDSAVKAHMKVRKTKESIHSLQLEVKMAQLMRMLIYRYLKIDNIKYDYV
jgi:hypothetical protein